MAQEGALIATEGIFYDGSTNKPYGQVLANGVLHSGWPLKFKRYYFGITAQQSYAVDWLGVVSAAGQP